VRGNMDRHQVKALKKAMAKQSGAHWLGKGKEVEVDGRRIAITHGDREAVYEDLLNAKPDYLFVGHTHRRSDQQIGSTRVINPGALGGVEYEARSIGILDLVSGQLEVVHLS
jgi:predicted phosphodiesterase